MSVASTATPPTSTDPDLADRPIAAIGARWGYPDPAHFSRLFKSAYGMGPRDYRYHAEVGRVNG